MSFHARYRNVSYSLIQRLTQFALYSFAFAAIVPALSQSEALGGPSSNAEVMRDPEENIVPPQRTASARVKQAVDYLMNNLSSQVAGGVIVVSLRGEPDRIAPFGFADVENGQGMTGESTLAYGSVTKSFSGALAASLASDQLLDLDAPVSDSFPELQLAGGRADATFAQLLSHSGGLPRHDFAWMFRPIDSDDLFHFLPALPFAAEPGEAFIYSNLGYHIFGEWLDRHQELEIWNTELRKRILRPLAFESIFYCDGVNQKPSASPYERDLSGNFVKSTKPFYLEPIAPAGALCGNIQELAQWFRLFDQGGWNQESKSLFEKISERLFAETTPISKTGVYGSYSFGLIQGDREGSPILWHNGGIPGYSSHASLDRNSGAIIAVATNSNVDLDTVVFNAHRMLNGERIQESTPQAPELISFTEVPFAGPGAISDLVGTYSHPAYGNVTVELIQDNCLKVTLNDWLTIAPLIHTGFGVFSMATVARESQSLLQVTIQDRSLYWNLETLTAPIIFARNTFLPD